MKSRVRRGAIVAAGICLLGVCTATPSSAGVQAQATGTFHWQSSLLGSQSISSPVIGMCYSTPVGRSATNETDALAKLYVDGNCQLLAVSVNPHDSSSTLAFFSVKFSAL
jgi:hypothetical protein